MMAPFGGGGSYMLGLISRESPPMYSKALNDELISVLIPTTPTQRLVFSSCTAKAT